VIRRCEDHGFFDEERCPSCDREGDPVLAEDRRAQLSKFCSGALRHFPDDAGIELDDAGWTEFDDLVAAAVERYDWADRETVAGVVATDPKDRYEHRRPPSDEADRLKVDEDGTISTDEWGGKIRAAYGHSVEVDLGATDDPVPDRLYHGTAPGNLDSIRRAGLRPIGRQRVHLSGTVEAAREVGRRHADDPAILVVDADRLQDVGHEVNRRGEGVYTTDRVPPEHLAVLHGGDREGSLLDAVGGEKLE